MSNKVIFLIGGPGSGKDILLKTVLQKYDLIELKLEQSIPILTEEKQFNFQNKNVIISTKANDYSTIASNKILWEHLNFETAMIFVDVNTQTSKERLQSRLISEESILEKLQESKNNIPKFETLFDNFILFENNIHIEENVRIKDVDTFCTRFLHLNNIFESKTIKAKLLKKYPLRLDKEKHITVSPDNVNQGYDAKDPTGYAPNFSSGIGEGIEYTPDVSPLANDVRSTVPTEIYTPTPQIHKRTFELNGTVQAIKKLARKRKRKNARKKFTIQVT